jgi:hypothetical protein
VRVADNLKPDPVVIASHKLNPPLPVAQELIHDLAAVIAKAVPAS